MISLREETQTLRRKCSDLESELAIVKPERDDYRDTVDALLEDCESYVKRIKQLEAKFSPETRDRILAELGVGKQSPLYKRVKALLDKLIKEQQ